MTTNVTYENCQSCGGDFDTADDVRLCPHGYCRQCHNEQCGPNLLTPACGGVVDDYGYPVPSGKGPWQTMKQFRAANKAAGQHYFDADTMRFFDSRVESDIIGGRFFVTSEQFHPSAGPSTPRGYSVHVAWNNGHVGTVGEFGGMHHDDPRRGYATYEEAKRAAERLAEVIGAKT